MSITTQQVSERLLKKSQGVAETNYPLGVRGIGEESIGTYNLVLSEDIWVQSSLIPLDAPSLLDNEESGVVKYYDKLQLKVVDGGTNVSFISENGELKDCISGKFGFSYKPKIFNTNGDIQIYNGSWMVDYESGVLTFYDINDPEIEAVVNSSNPPLISFYKYIGKKGIDGGDFERNITTGSTYYPNPNDYKNGDEWVDSDTLIKYTLYDDGDNKQWVVLEAGNIVSGGTVYGNYLDLSGGTVSGDIVANLFIKNGGQQDEYLMANGNVIKTGDTLAFNDLRYVRNTGDTINGTLNINGNININGDIFQSGSGYTTHAQDIYTSNDTIILREGALTGLPSTGFTGIIAKNYDGLYNNSLFVFDSNGIPRVGKNTLSETSPIAVIENNPISNGFTYWNNINKKLSTKILSKNDITGLTFIETSGGTITGNLIVNNDLKVKTITDNNNSKGQSGYFLMSTGTGFTWSNVDIDFNNKFLPLSGGTINGQLQLLSTVVDNYGDTGLNGQVLQSTGSGIKWTTITSNGGSSISFTYFNVSLPVSGWTNNLQTVIVNGIKSDSDVTLLPHPDSFIDCSNSAVRAISLIENQITFKCEIKPTNTIVINGKYLNDGSYGYSYYTGILYRDSWVNKEQSIYIDNLDDNDDVTTSPTPEDFIYCGYSQIRAISQGGNNLLFKCSILPEKDITINIKILKV